AKEYLASTTHLQSLWKWNLLKKFSHPNYHGLEYSGFKSRLDRKRRLSRALTKALLDIKGKE
ncbi:MAG: hypothetical protein OEY95_07075, partial [Candidatus Bathyarchaeota archaeon]|nr:hypothetical protein [Candidatus Bathyarchaeota archaeon]